MQVALRIKTKASTTKAARYPGTASTRIVGWRPTTLSVMVWTTERLYQEYAIGGSRATTRPAQPFSAALANALISPTTHGNPYV